MTFVMASSAFFWSLELPHFRGGSLIWCSCDGRRDQGRPTHSSFQDEHAVDISGTTLTLKHYGAAHTDSDISVYFTDADILHTGDTFWNGAYPFIDYSTGGSIDGQIRAAEKNPARVTGWSKCATK
jgi:glyoxylase-like metal-dependent hydrolase (beta-lactamase superfamily II)